ncbi:hypothetical protein ACTHS0_11545, partial [Neisseria sp. P0013.S009]|uniref:hypothetical protein n=1 Tax=Neisseria sp. P0013.S009 TaxID=3436745 RepID=UPI003F82237B
MLFSVFLVLVVLVVCWCLGVSGVDGRFWFGLGGLFGVGFWVVFGVFGGVVVVGCGVGWWGFVVGLLLGVVVFGLVFVGVGGGCCLVAGFGLVGGLLGAVGVLDGWLVGVFGGWFGLGGLLDFLGRDGLRVFSGCVWRLVVVGGLLGLFERSLFLRRVWWLLDAV